MLEMRWRRGICESQIGGYRCGILVKPAPWSALLLEVQHIGIQYSLKWHGSKRIYKSTATNNDFFQEFPYDVCLHFWYCL